MASKVRKAVFPVGGLGTRFLPATKSMPKEMLTVVDKPIIHYAVEEAAAAGIEEFIFVTGRGKTTIEDHFDFSFELDANLRAKNRFDVIDAMRNWLPKSGQVAYTRQGEPLGLGHAVWCARHLVGDEPFAVLLADDMVLSKRPCLRQLIDVHEARGGNVVAVMDVPREQVNRYGVLAIGADDGRLAEVKGLVEKPHPSQAPSTLSIIGRYVLMPEVFDHLNAHMKGAGGEIQLTDALARMIGRGAFHGLRFEGERFDCGDKLGFLKATVAFALSRDDLREGLDAYLRAVTGPGKK
ncbi:MAG: UTP--glucose-1-phosphate uridylyltransferase GalU [Alphaproteobacteria bacterium]|nr:UTP--glucose-1-phosphate uridylyltransferase GalU [Alphaproteobacteria bacterium]